MLTPMALKSSKLKVNKIASAVDIFMSTVKPARPLHPPPANFTIKSSEERENESLGVTARCHTQKQCS